MSKFGKRFLLALLAAGFLGTTLTACNTMKGLGEDMEAAGEAIQNKAEKED